MHHGGRTGAFEKELQMADERIARETDTTPPAEVDKPEVNRESPDEAEQKRQQAEYDEVLDDRFQATDN